MGYAPFGQGHINEVYDDPILVAIADKYGKTPRQVVLRMQLQQGVVVIPKTLSRERLAENINVFDFELTAEEIKTLEAMDKEQPIIGNPQNPALVEMSTKW